MKVKVAGVWKSPTLNAKVAGAWKPISKALVKVAGTWRPFYMASNYRPVPGEVYGGGVCVGIITINGIEYALVTSVLSAQNNSIAFNTGSKSNTNAKSKEDGLLNTSYLTASKYAAAKYCINYRGGGFNDWYLPASGELQFAYENWITQFHATYYLSSSMISSDSIITVLMSTGELYSTNRSTGRVVRPFRRVRLTP